MKQGSASNHREHRGGSGIGVVEPSHFGIRIADLGLQN